MARRKVRLQAHAAAVDRSKRCHHDTVTTRDNEILDAGDYGLSIPEIADATGLSYSRVAAILANSALRRQDAVAAKREEATG